MPAPASAAGAARAEVSGDRIRVTTGTVERVWEWTGKGLVTTTLRDLGSGRERAINLTCGVSSVRFMGSVYGVRVHGLTRFRFPSCL